MGDLWATLLFAALALWSLWTLREVHRLLREVIRQLIQNQGEQIRMSTATVTLAAAVSSLIDAVSGNSKATASLAVSSEAQAQAILAAIADLKNPDVTDNSAAIATIEQATANLLANVSQITALDGSTQATTASLAAAISAPGTSPATADPPAPAANS